MVFSPVLSARSKAREPRQRAALFIYLLRRPFPFPAFSLQPRGGGGAARASVCAPSRAPGAAARAPPAAKEGKSRRKPLLLFSRPLLSSSAEACLEAPFPHRAPQFLPVFEVARPGGFGRGYRIEPWIEWWPSCPSSKALRTGKASGPVRSFENRRRQAGRDPGPGIGERGHEFHPVSETDQQGDLSPASGFPSRRFSLSP